MRIPLNTFYTIDYGYLNAIRPRAQFNLQNFASPWVSRPTKAAHAPMGEAASERTHTLIAVRAHAWPSGSPRGMSTWP